MDFGADPFGQRRSPVWGQPTLASFPSLTTVGFTGQENDGELGLVNFKGRIYDPKVGKPVEASMNFEIVAQQIISFPGGSVGAGVTDNDIDEVSRRLNVPICGGYRLFLKRFGWADIADFDVFGLGSDVPRCHNLAVVAESEWTEVDPPLPHHLLPVMNNGGGDLVCLDTKASPDEPPVVMWWHEDGASQVPQPTAPDFASWLSNMIEDRKGNE